jgi:hypothetical protein
MNPGADILKKVCHSRSWFKWRSLEGYDWDEDDAPVTSHVLSALQSDGWAQETNALGVYAGVNFIDNKGKFEGGHSF